MTIELGKTRVDYLKIEGYFGLFCQFCAWKGKGKEENEKETGCKWIAGNGYDSNIAWLIWDRYRQQRT